MITKFDEKMFARAREVAETSNFPGFHIGCVLTYKHRIINEKANTTKTHPKQMEYNKRYRHFTPGPSRHTLHAELSALLTVPTAMLDRINWKDVSVYVYRISPGHKSGMGLARPCPSCMHQIKELGIHHIYYTTDDGYAYERLDY